MLRPETIAHEEMMLNNWIELAHGDLRGRPMTKKEFLPRTWQALSSLVRYNRRNELVQHAAREHGDFMVRSFVILSVLHGAYSSVPNLVSFLKDFVRLLTKDLVEEELKVVQYAQPKIGDRGSFFPKLGLVLALIREVYGAKHFSLSVLPPTPHHAYALFVLNHFDLLEKELSREELFGHLAVSDHQIMGLLSLVKPRK